MSRILIIDDESNMRRVLSLILSEDRHEMTEAASLSEARSTLSKQQFDLVLVDQNLSDGTGLSLLAEVRENEPTLPCVMITAYATVELAVEAMRAGAFDFIPKPFVSENVRAVVRRACERSRLGRENVLLKEQVRLLSSGDQLLGQSPPIGVVREFINRVAPTSATVLIMGETGTGKELAARAVHAQSPRSAMPFVAINCASLTETLLESELFGHEKGAFTGADRTRVGLFESADGGTLFLDEAGEMSLSLQAKLLRVLVDGQVQRVGGRTSKKIDVRMIVATHRDLMQRVKQDLFREDLYYRIAVVPITMPPLRDRMDDLPMLVEHFLNLASVEMKLPRRSVMPDALHKLSGYSFPGNIRELRNLIERACILASSDKITQYDFPLGDSTMPVLPRSDSIPENMDMRQYLDEVEKGLIIRALSESNGVQAEAARRLGLSRSDMNYKLKKFGISPIPR